MPTLKYNKIAHQTILIKKEAEPMYILQNTQILITQSFISILIILLTHFFKIACTANSDTISLQRDHKIITRFTND